MKQLAAILIVTISLLSQESSRAQTKHSATSAHTSYTGLSMTGYQGWFGTPNDGGTNNWRHYKNSEGFRPGSASIEYWPDMRETDEDERHETAFVFEDGTPASVFSSVNSKTVNRHFQWMKEYGIDGAFVQRFKSDFGIRPVLSKVMLNALEGAENNGRAVAVMYDIGANIYENGTDSVSVNARRTYHVDQIFDDWKEMVDDLSLTSRGASQSYLYHDGKPLVALWGVGFPHRHNATGLDMEFWVELVDKFVNDSVYGHCSILLGVPTYWREGGRDCISGSEHTKMIDLIKEVAAIMPWHTSRFRRSDMATTYKDLVQTDNNWCSKTGIAYAPNVSAGIREKILHGNDFERPREGGYYYWDMGRAAIEAGSQLLYLGMFDEIDEGTQIHKVNNRPPFYSHSLSFASYGDDPEDHYLWLAGEITRAMKGEFIMGPDFRTRADDRDFHSEITFVDHDTTYDMHLSAPAPGRKVYYADPYKVQDGAPTVGTPRDTALFPHQVTSGAKMTFGKVQRGQFIRFVEVDSLTDKIITFKAIVATRGYATIPYATSFEEGDVDLRHWRVTTENSTGRAQVTDKFEAKTGSFHLAMDVPTSEISSTNQADLYVDLEDFSKDILLGFSFQIFDQEINAEDGIFFSSDGGRTFEKIFGFEADPGVYTDTILNITRITESIGLSLSETSVIRFQHRAAQPISSDGITLDDINLLHSTERSGYAQFLNSDDNTQGNWMGHYGTDGHYIVEKDSSLPSSTQITWDPFSKTIVWEDNSTDVRGLQYHQDSTILSARYADDTDHPWWFTIDVGAEESEVSIYFLDGDHQQRKFALSVVDGATGDKYDARTLQSFEDGIWLTWKIRGRVRFVMDAPEGLGAVVSGIFISPTTPSAIEAEVVEYLSFDGLDDFVDCGRGQALQLSGSEITLEAWFKIDSTKTSTYQSTILAMDHSEAGNDVGYFLRANGTGQAEWGFGDGNWHEVESEDGLRLFEMETWNHVAGVYDGSTQSIYVNGNLVASRDSVFASVAPAPAESLYIGSTPSFSDRVIGAGLAEIRIWNIARSESDIKAFSMKRITGTETGLVGYWPIDEGQGQIISDASSNSSDGILGGGTAEDNLDPLWRNNGTVGVRGIDQLKGFELMQNYPNPFHQSTTITYHLPTMSNIQLSIYRVNGKKVVDLVHRKVGSGTYQATWSTHHLPGGIYIAVLKTKAGSITKQMLLTK